MLEPPSPQLVSLLRELRICTAADFRRCRARVRKLATDLPAFDSVWIDALVQSGKLTPFQAQILESNHPSHLQLGGSLLVNALGKGLLHETWIARSLGGHEFLALKLIPAGQVRSDQAQLRLKRLVSEIQRRPHPHIVGPHALEQSDRGLLLLSRYIPGQTLSEMLIRRGRFPSSVVAEIARQLLTGLRELHQRGLVHGEILLRNIRLTEAGTAVLVDAGVLPAAAPELVPHANINPERYDGIAPELIGTGQPPTPGSDLYALGCLLWQLLAGRPPFPGGDSLAKLATHRAKRIEDVRELAPDTPSPLAELIRQLTTPDPRQRSAFSTSLFTSGKNADTIGRRRLAKFVRNFRLPTDWNDDSSTGLRQAAATWVMLLGFLMLGLGVTLADFEARTQLWSLIAEIPHKFSRRENIAAISSPDPPSKSLKTPVASEPKLLQTAFVEEHLEPLPAPDSLGVIELDPGLIYQAGEINAVGPLTIRTRPGSRAKLLVTDARYFLNLTATKVELSNLDLEWKALKQPSNVTPPRALSKIRAQSLTLRNCRLTTAHESPTSGSGNTPRGIPALAWKGIDPLPGGNQLLAENCEFIGPGTAIYLDNQINRASLKNVLKVSSGELIRLGDETASSFTELRLEEVTCRQSGSLIRVSTDWIAARLKRTRPLTLTTRNCAFDLLPQTAALVEMHGPQTPPTAWQGLFLIQGEDSLTTPPLQVALWHSPQGTQPRVLSAAQVSLEGIMETQFRFAGDSLKVARQSEIAYWDFVPRASQAPPGYRLPNRAERLPPKALHAN